MGSWHLSPIRSEYATPHFAALQSADNLQLFTSGIGAVTLPAHEEILVVTLGVNAAMAQDMPLTGSERQEVVDKAGSLLVFRNTALPGMAIQSVTFEKVGWDGFAPPAR
jgi:hypothetical protein